MRLSNRATEKSIAITLATGGLILAWAQLAVALEPARLAVTPQEPEWTATHAAPAAVADEMREALRSELRTEMVAALRPDSVVWKGALDGYKLALQMREEMREEMRGEMIADMREALGDIRLPRDALTRPHEAEPGDPGRRVVRYGRFAYPPGPPLP
ncbi:MAG: hypothetical protein NZ990_14750 [Myxococcota bacterium]|nr:hypothetical protein [Myxococcota bacterium]